MHLSRFLRGIRSDQSVQNGHKFFPKILFRCRCAHGNNGRTRRSRKSFNGDQRPGDQLVRVLDSNSNNWRMSHSWPREV